MSRRKRPASHYASLAKRLSQTNSHFEKYTELDPEKLTGAQRAALQRAAYAAGIDSKPEERSDRSFILAARGLKHYIPSLEKYAAMDLRKTKLTPAQRGAITHKENLIKHVPHLIPLRGKAKKELKAHYYAPGVAAIALDNTNDHAKLHYINKKLFVTNNGRTWLYMSLSARPASMKKGAKKAFGKIEKEFPMTQITEIVAKAFRRPTTREVYLWASAGRVGQGYQSLKQFMRWFNRAYGGYTQTQKWVKGIAIRLGEPPRGKQQDDDELDDDFEDDGDYDDE